MLVKSVSDGMQHALYVHAEYEHSMMHCCQAICSAPGARQWFHAHIHAYTAASPRLRLRLAGRSSREAETAGRGSSPTSGALGRRSSSTWSRRRIP